MPFGRRRFQSLVLMHEQMVAYFLPLDDLSAPAEYVGEEKLRHEIVVMGHVSHAEELLAVKAFDQMARGKKGSRATAEAAVARRGQTSIVDPLQPQERALVERWRKRVERKGTSPLPEDDTLTDLPRRVIAEILDVYLPRGTEPKGT